MAVVQIDLGDAAQTARIIDAFAAEDGWTPDLGITKAVFAKRQLIRYIKDKVKSHEMRLVAAAARADVDSNVNPT